MSNSELGPVQSSRWTKYIILFCLGVILLYGLGRLYFCTTGGFCLSNITSNFTHEPRWEMRALSESEQEDIKRILSQEFRYLGKGCQSYVFVSADGEYVIKFFKYQRFRPQFWLRYFTFIPPVSNYYDKKVEEKKHKLEALFTSWKIAFEELQAETGLVYVHLNNNTHFLPANFFFYDKIGLKHTVDMNKMEFLIQRKADMLCPAIEQLMVEGKKQNALLLLDKLLALIISEYHRNLADNDHALMQNTGVYRGEPIHVDVGQFVKNQEINDPSLYHQELFNKAYKFRIWLQKNYPELLQHFDRELQREMGNTFFQMKHLPKKKN
ncbi:MAG TPA: hypothetical protein VIH61_01625 [Waddliaceae bacterium]